MPRKSKPVSALSKWGLPKNFMTSAYSENVPANVRRWAEQRNEVDALLLDALDAYEEGILDRAGYLAEKKTLSFRMRRALQEYDKALRRK